jgi:4-aminobutyrate aminotransferase-like enzyme
LNPRWQKSMKRIALFLLLANLTHPDANAISPHAPCSALLTSQKKTYLADHIVAFQRNELIRNGYIQISGTDYYLKKNQIIYLDQAFLGSSFTLFGPAQLNSNEDDALKTGFEPHPQNPNLLRKPLRNRSGQIISELLAWKIEPDIDEFFSVEVPLHRQTSGDFFQRQDTGFELFSLLNSQRIQEQNIEPDTLIQLYQTAFLLSLTDQPSLLNPSHLDDLRGVTRMALTQDSNEFKLALQIMERLIPLEAKVPLLGQAASLARSGTPQPEIKEDRSLHGLHDSYDLLRGYGFRLLSRDHSTFSDPDFLLNILKYSGARGTGAAEADSDLLMDFETFWRDFFGPHTLPLALTQTGSDANALIFDILAFVGEINHRGKLELAFFESIYGAGRGTLSGSGAFKLTGTASREEKVRGITLTGVPYIFKNEEELSADEIQTIQAQENEFMTSLEELIEKRNIGGILLETMAGRFFSYNNKAPNSKWLTFRRDFLLRLRSFSDQNDILIFVDDVMNFSRTGKVYSWEHFPGFEPDYFTFGKGSYIAGIAQLHRSDFPSSVRFAPSRPYGDIMGYASRVNPKVLFSITNHAPAASLLETMKILGTVRQAGLIEESARVGSYLMTRLKEVCEEVHGKGMHIIIKNCDFGSTRLSAANILYDRILPPLDLTIEQVDFLFEEKN